MRIAVTGATGNIGTALLKRLTDQPDIEVVGLARRLPGDGHAHVRWASVDLADDDAGTVLRAAFDGCDAVVHLAWGFQPSHRPGRLEAVGVGGTRQVIRAASAVGVPHLVHMSSVGAYSPKEDDRPVDERWPTGGVPTSPYSRHKAAAERLLDEHEARGTGPLVARLRPGVVGQRAAGSALLRYGIPGYLPAPVLRALPVLPLDRTLRIPVVHADDVAHAIERVLRQTAVGAFNLATQPPADPDLIAAALGARHVHVPARVLRAAVTGSWRAHLQQVDPGWLDLGMQVPLMDTGRAERELGWAPARSAEEVLRETVGGMAEAAHAPTPVLRPRTVAGRLHDLVRRGPVSLRSEP